MNTGLYEMPLRLDQQVDVCIFDFDGTLYPSSAGIEGQIKDRFRICASKMLNLTDNEVRKLLHQYRTKYRSSVLGLEKHHGIDPFEFYEELYSGIDIGRMLPKAGLKEALESLSRSKPLYVFSNSNRSFVLRGLDHLGLTAYITDAFTVESFNFIRKPHQEVYLATVDRVGYSADKVCMFDDIPSSLETAKKVGFVTVLVGNGLRDSGFVDLHTGEEYTDPPEYCDYAAPDIAKFIREKLVAR